MAPETTKATRGARPVDHAGRSGLNRSLKKPVSMPDAECQLPKSVKFRHLTFSIDTFFTVLYTPPAPANFRDWKHSRQKTGRPCVGRNGTVVSLPHAEQLVVVSTRSRPIAAPPPAGRAARLALQLLQRFGSFLKFLSAKNSCSPAVQIKGAPQSTQVRVLSRNSIVTSLARPRARRARRVAAGRLDARPATPLHRVSQHPVH
jgi:hypothetical protein